MYLLQNLPQRITDANGAVCAGALMYFYVTGTTTPKTAYADQAGSTPHPNPLAANAGGQFAQVWLNNDTEYRVKVTKADGTVLYTWDDVSGVGANIARLSSANDGEGDALVAVVKSWGGAVRRTQHSVNNDTACITDFLPSGFNTTADATAYVQVALSCGAKVVDFMGLALKCDQVTVPEGVWAKNIDLTKFTDTAGNVVLVNTGAVVTGKIAGTGLVSAIQRCIYSAADGVADVALNVEVSDATIGVHAQYLTSDAEENWPKRWTGYVYVHDIVGTVGASEGYGVILSPANACVLTINAKAIARHALYLSAGTRDCDISLMVDDCQNYAAQLYSTSDQSATINNTVRVKARNLSENVAGQGGAVAIVQKAHYNTVIVEQEGNGLTSYAVKVEGSSGGPYPKGNKVINGSITGQYIGTDVICMVNADSTHVRGNSLHCFATVSVVGMRRSGTNGSVHGGWVDDNDIDCQGQSIKGVYDECNTQPSWVGPNSIRNNGAALRVDDQTGGKRQGFSRRVAFSGTTASIAGLTSGDTAVTLPDNMQTTGRNTSVMLTGASVQFFDNPFWVGISAPPSETQLTFRAYNGHSAAQTFTYAGWVEGD